jgi:prolyl-tRNA synthetase
MVLAESGEDAVVSCDSCDYAANMEKAEVRAPAEAAAAGTATRAKVATPGHSTIEQVAAFLGVPAERVVKTLIFDTDQGPVAALVRGDHEVNAIKLAKAVGAARCEPAVPEVVTKATGAPVGFAGPVGLNIPIVADLAVRALADFVVGANEADTHFTGVNLADFAVTTWADIRNARAGDPCPRCTGGRLRIHRGIEVGHIFKLGTKYSVAMRANFLDEAGKETPLVMGCYGIGIGRTAAAAIEQNHDDAGIRFPIPIAPYEVVIVSILAKQGQDEVLAASRKIHDDLRARGVEVLWDDRDERPGAKFKDADLIGVPLRVTVGGKGLATGNVELKARTEKEFTLVPVGEVAGRVAAIVAEAKRAD